LRHPAPTYVLDEDLLFFGSSFAAFCFDLLESFNGGYVVVKLRADSAFAKMVLWRDVVIVSNCI